MCQTTFLDNNRLDGLVEDMQPVYNLSSLVKNTNSLSPEGIGMFSMSLTSAVAVKCGVHIQRL